MNEIQNVEAGYMVLDIRAGLGHFMLSFKLFGLDTYGIEPSLHFYERAVEKMGVDPAKLKLASVEDCEFEDNMFDVIFFRPCWNICTSRLSFSIR
jgi:hypothetical protein